MKKALAGWSRAANLKFKLKKNGGEVRISFQPITHSAEHPESTFGEGDLAHATMSPHFVHMNRDDVSHLSENELLFQFNLVTKFQLGRNDWILVVNKNMEELGIRLSEDQVMKISLIKFKDNVQTNIKSVVRKSFEEKRGSKTAALNLETFNHSSYVLKTYKQR